MATTTQGTSRANGRAAKSDTQRIEEQIERLKSDLGGLTDALTRAGSNKAGDIRDDFDAQIESLTRLARSYSREARRSTSEAEVALREQVREKPFQALGIAALAGFVIAGLLRR